MTLNTNKKAEVEEIVIELIDKRTTKNTHMFEEVLGDQQWSEKDIAVGNLYIQTEALQMLGSPKRIKVTIEAADTTE
jgi:hypothetical protein